MSGPLSWFRKNQKILLGVFGVLLMFVFTVSLGSGVDPIVDFLSGGGARGPNRTANETVVSWKGGQLTESDLQNMRVGTANVQKFLQAGIQTALARGADRDRVLAAVQTMDLAIDDEGLLQSHLLAEKGRNLGLVVTDDSVNDFLTSVTDGVLSGSELGSILKQVSQGRMGQNQVFEILREKLLVQKAYELVQSGIFPISPVASWGLSQSTESPR